MTRYIARRLAFSALLVVAVSSASLVLTRIAPGDYVIESTAGQVSRLRIEEERARYGLDKSIGAQYRDWLAAAVRLDFGRSMQYDRPVRDLIPERAANTAILALTALLIATGVGLPLAAMLERLQAQAMSQAIGEPFVLATLARGVPRSRVVWRDALKAALRPVAAIYGLIVGALLSGSFAVEVISAWPGLGTLMLGALRTRDVYLVAGCAGAGALFLAFGTLVSDVALALVDPRVSETAAEGRAGA
ncbi:MAG: hypothetical protein DMF96_25605 [Acidobacteria bacterium]|nr:MAG: hypothetical protein DMF96_25605 [Acidobacteriota bacterium]